MAATWLLSAPHVEAQIKFGLKVGANVSKAHINKQMFSSDNRLGFLIGPMVDVKVPILGLGFDIAAQYNCKYAQLDAREGSDMVSATPAFHTIDVPINVKWTLGNDNFVSVYAATGPQFSWNVGGEDLKSILNVSQYTLNSSNFSWNIGAGINIIRSFRVGYNYNIAISATAEMKNYKDGVKNVLKGNLRNHNHQFFIVHFF